MIEALVVFLRFDNRIKITTVTDVHDQLTDAGRPNLDCNRMQKTGDVGDFDGFDIAATRSYRASTSPAGVSSNNWPGVLGVTRFCSMAHGNRTDSAMTTHWKAAAYLDKQYAQVILLAGWRIKYGTRHRIMTAWLKHKPGPDPVVIPDKMLAPFTHAFTAEFRSITDHHTNRISAGMGINYSVCLPGHGCNQLCGSRQNTVLAVAVVMAANHIILGFLVIMPIIQHPMLTHF